MTDTRIDAPHRSTGSAPTTERPWSLLVPLLALLVSELVHITATALNHGLPAGHHASFGPTLHVIGVALTIGVVIWVFTGGRWAAPLTAATGISLVAAAFVYHVVPASFDYNNPFWEGASAAQWASVVAGVAVGMWCAVAGLRHADPDPG